MKRPDREPDKRDFRVEWVLGEPRQISYASEVSEGFGWRPPTVLEWTHTVETPMQAVNYVYEYWYEDGKVIGMKTLLQDWQRKYGPQVV